MATRAELDIDVEGPQARTRATLLSVARPIPSTELTRSSTNRLIGGVTWLPWPDLAPTRDEADCDTVYDKEPRSLPDLLTQSSFLVWDSLQCSTAGLRLASLAEMTRSSVDEFISAQFALELESASNTAGLDLTAASTTVINTTATGVQSGIAALEDYLATTSGKPGMQGVIHLTPGLLVIAESEGIIEFRDGAYRTATGTAVVGDAGHTGQVAPSGESAPGANEAWIYATGDIWYAHSDVVGVDTDTDADGGAVYIARNQNRPLAERYGLLVFDTNTVAATLVTTTVSAGGGGGGGDASAANQATGNASLAAIEDGQELATLTHTAPAEAAIGTAATIHGWSLYNSHATDAVLIYIRHGNADSSTPFDVIAIAAGQSVNVDRGQRKADGTPVGGSGVYVTDESAGAAAITDLVGRITTGAA